MSMRKRILIVDDDQRVVMTIMQFFVNSTEYECVSAPDGKAGLKAARKEHPSLILLDIEMPKMNGLEVLKQLKGDPDTQRIPIIMLTGVNTDEAKTEANYEYAEDYIVKPFEWPVLKRKIERVLALRP